VRHLPYDNTGPLTSTSLQGVLSDYLRGMLACVALNPANLILLALVSEEMLGPIGAGIWVVCEALLGCAVMHGARKAMRTNGRIMDDGPDYGAGT